tara:strand:+ start:555 stop:1178 length:624 start_codon:yes stop_codon:yes gene_type:complete
MAKKTLIIQKMLGIFFSIFHKFTENILCIICIVMENEDYEAKLNELQLEIEDTEEITPIKKVKKKRKPMTADHKAKCLAALEKARAASQLKRGKKAKAKKIIKEKDEAEVDKILDLHLKDKAEKEGAKDKEIADLKKKLNSLTLQDVIPKPPKKVVIVEPEDDPESEPAPPVQPVVKVEPLPSTNVLSNPIPSIRRHIIKPRMKPRR